MNLKYENVKLVIKIMLLLSLLLNTNFSFSNFFLYENTETIKAKKKFMDDGLPLDFTRNVSNLTKRIIIDEWAGIIASASNKRKGNFGEIGADLNSKGYTSHQPRIEGIDSKGHNGIDIVVEKNGEFFIVEAKYSGSSAFSPANMATGLPKQMTDAWISQNDWKRLRDAIGDELAEDIIATNNYRRILAKTAEDGSVTYDELDEFANKIGSWNP